MNIPAVSYMALVGLYAHAKGLPYFTWEDRVKARKLYELDAALLN